MQQIIKLTQLLLITIVLSSCTKEDYDASKIIGSWTLTYSKYGSLTDYNKYVEFDERGNVTLTEKFIVDGVSSDNKYIYKYVLNTEDQILIVTYNKDDVEEFYYELTSNTLTLKGTPDIESTTEIYTKGIKN